MESLPHKISSLVYLRDRAGKLLLMQRNKAPNKGLWSPIGGKLETGTGESPHEAAAREVAEEIGLKIPISNLHLFSIIAEKNYEDRCHWLMFLFDCRVPLETLPPPISEGSFAFFEESEIAELQVPETDRQSLWTIYFDWRRDFIALRADCRSDRPLEVHVDEAMRLGSREDAK